LATAHRAAEQMLERAGALRVAGAAAAVVAVAVAAAMAAVPEAVTPEARLVRVEPGMRRREWVERRAGAAVRKAMLAVLREAVRGAVVRAVRKLAALAGEVPRARQVRRGSEVRLAAEAPPEPEVPVSMRPCVAAVVRC